MENTMVSDLDLEIETITNSLAALNDNIKSDFEEYILIKASLFENRCIIKDSLDLVNSFDVSASEHNANNQTRKCIYNVHNDLKTVYDKLETTLESYSFIKSMIRLDNILHRVAECADFDYCKAAEHLIEAKSLLEESSKPGRSLDFFKLKNEEYYKCFTDLSLKSLENWNNLVCFKSEDCGNKTKVSSLTISSDFDKLNSTYKTLEVLKVPYKESFSDAFYKDLITPILNYNCKWTIENNSFAKFSVEYSQKTSKLLFGDIVDILVKLFEFINSHLDLNFEPQSSFIGSIGVLTVNALLELLLTEHLLKKIPLKRVQIVEYEVVLLDLKKLLTALTAKGFLNENHSFIKEYCCDAVTVFENKVGSRYEESAMFLMKQDLHDIVTINSISLEYSMPELRQSLVSSDESERDYWNSFITLFNNDSRRRSFLECQISKSIGDLAILIHDCLKEASQTNTNLTISLQNSAHRIVYEYIKSPDIHRKLLDIIPQQSALVFTNSLYIIMKLLHFDREFSTDNLFGELIGQLQIMAFRELNKQVRAQEDIIVLSLQKCGLHDLSELEVFPKAVEKAVRQCLRQAVLLQTVWNSVLPQDVYSIIMGRLVNRLLEEIISFILMASDIREDIANNLVELITLITEKAPQVFIESREVHRHVKNWMKLREIGLVLAGSLADIRERWAGGTGPLAHELEATQVRSLIVALFQSSEIRQRTLATIH